MPLHITDGTRFAALKGGSGSVKPQSGYALCAVLLRHSLGRGQCFALPYNLPKPSYTSNVMRKFCKCMQKDDHFECVDKIENYI